LNFAIRIISEEIGYGKMHTLKIGKENWIKNQNDPKIELSIGDFPISSTKGGRTIIEND
jgi:hypothetical protein